MQGGGEYGTRIARLCMDSTDARDASTIGESLEFGSTVGKKNVSGLELL